MVHESPFIAYLREHGLLDAFNARWNQLRSTTDSPNQAWYVAAKEYGWTARGWKPPEDDEPDEPSTPEPSVEPGGLVVDHVKWAYEHLHDEKIGAEHAPSKGAAAYLEWGRANQTKFMTVIVPKFLAKVDGRAVAKAAVEADRDRLLDLVGRLRKNFGERVVA